MRPTRRVLWTALAALAVLAADFASKRTVQQSLELGERHEIVPGWVVLTHIENTGAAYGLLAGQRWLLVISAGAIALLTPFLLRALPARGRFGWAGPVITGMILGGALGNLVQRAAAGYVTDFIQTPPIELFQVFNIADAAISVAIAGLVIISLFGDEKELSAPAAALFEPATGDAEPAAAAAAPGAEPVEPAGPEEAATEEPAIAAIEEEPAPESASGDAEPVEPAGPAEAAASAEPASEDAAGEPADEAEAGAQPPPGPEPATTDSHEGAADPADQAATEAPASAEEPEEATHTARADGTAAGDDGAVPDGEADTAALATGTAAAPPSRNGSAPPASEREQPADKPAG